MTETKTTVKRDGQRDLKFGGQLLGSASSKTHSCFRWTEILIHKTDSGKYVIETRGLTCVDGETNRFNGYICETEAAVVKQLADDNEGYLGNLSKEAMAEAKIDYAEEI